MLPNNEGNFIRVRKQSTGERFVVHNFQYLIRCCWLAAIIESSLSTVVIASQIFALLNLSLPLQQHSCMNLHRWSYLRLVKTYHVEYYFKKKGWYVIIFREKYQIWFTSSRHFEVSCCTYYPQLANFHSSHSLNGHNHFPSCWCHFQL